MICKRCQDNHHEDCKGGTWCDCQHADRAQFPAKV